VKPLASIEASCTKQIEVSGAVQGVGFRPFVHALATRFGLKGWIGNTCSGATILVSGAATTVIRFVSVLRCELPPPGRIESVSIRTLAPLFFDGFTIRDSSSDGTVRTPLLPDLVTCPNCLREISDPFDRRSGYPFTNCTHCGPRYTITEALPYDRPNTVMRSFELCPDCRREYGDPSDRRFHAQPIACVVCGPLLRFQNISNRFEVSDIASVAHALGSGAVVAIKGLGGYQLLCDPHTTATVARLRAFKARARKPFAVMCLDLTSCESLAELTQPERDALRSLAGPIVLASIRGDAVKLRSATGGLTSVGLMLPTTPLHHLLMAEYGRPLICTSANRGDEPLIYGDSEAETQLAAIADLVVTHNRPIAAPADDSVVRVIGGQTTVIRAARGVAPVYVATRHSGPTVLAVGTHLKNAPAIAFDDQIVLGPHVGTQDTLAAHERTIEVCRHLLAVYQREAEFVACDMHPDYGPTRYGHELGLPVIEVAHHHAHIAAVMAEHQLDGPVLGFSWDGTGYGTDGTIWGSEALICTARDFTRVATLRPIPLIGGEQAVRDGRRIALALLWEAFPERRTDIEFLSSLCRLDVALTRQFCRLLETNTSVAPSHGMGRLFDGVSALLNVCLTSDYEGEAATRLEWAAHGLGEGYEIAPSDQGIEHDWRPMVRVMVSDIRANVNAGEIAERFHAALTQWALAVARQHSGLPICLGGGCFQNKLLTEAILELLGSDGRVVHRGIRVPANDGGVAVGQAFVARARAWEGGAYVFGGSG
jgi:hydrogenase maturation protein HypF